MADAFRKMFWGYLFIVLEIHIAIDILADPIGYWLIYSGISAFAKEYKVAIKPRITSLALIVLSLPTVIIQGELNQQALGQTGVFTGWTIYFSSLHLLNLILVFYICRLLMEIANQQEFIQLGKSASNTSNAYIMVMLLAELFSSFAINLPNSSIAGMTFIVIFASLLMHILFLSLLHQYKKRFHEV